MSSVGSAPLFSVVIPTYNRAQKVMRAVESVLAQTVTDYDVWVIDDGSTDATAGALVPYLGRIHYVAQANQGVAAARNRGIGASAGKYVAILDSDDRWLPPKLATISRVIQDYPEAGLFYSQWDVVNEAGERLWVDRSRQVAGSAYQALLKGDFLAASSVVMRRECLESVGGFDSTMEPCEDWDLWLRISRKYEIRLVPEVLVAFEHTPQNKETSNIHKWLSAHDRVIEKAFAADPALSASNRREIEANLAYVKGRVCLQAGAEREARRYFKQAISIRPLLLKAQLYYGVLSSATLRRLLPPAIRKRLRLEDNKGNVY
jgi:glycosyltransferase involved in cell wall biosynthesis